MLNNLNLCNMIPGALYPYPLSIPMNFMPYGVERVCKYILVDTDLIKGSLNILKKYQTIGISDLYDYFNKDNKHKIEKEVLVIHITESKLKLVVTNCFSLEDKYNIEMKLEGLLDSPKEVVKNILSTLYSKTTIELQSDAFTKIRKLIAEEKLQPESVLKELQINDFKISVTLNETNFEIPENDELYFRIVQELNYIHMNRNHNEYTKDVLIRGKNSMVQKIEEDKYKVVTLNDEATVSTYTEALEYIIETDKK